MKQRNWALNSILKLPWKNLGKKEKGETEVANGKKREQIRKAEKRQTGAERWHTIHGSWFGFFDRLIFVSELCPCHSVLRLLLFQTLLQRLQFVVQIDFQVVLFLWGAATAKLTSGNVAEAVRHRQDFWRVPSPGYCSSPGLACALPPLLTGWASGFCCPLVTQPSLLRMAGQKKKGLSALFGFQEIKWKSFNSALSSALFPQLLFFYLL